MRRIEEREQERLRDRLRLGRARSRSVARKRSSSSGTARGLGNRPARGLPGQTARHQHGRLVVHHVEDGGPVRSRLLADLVDAAKTLRHQQSGLTPLPSKSALVPTVVPWQRKVISCALMPPSISIAMPSMMAREGSSGVAAALVIESTPVASSRQTKSEKCPRYRPSPGMCPTPFSLLAPRRGLRWFNPRSSLELYPIRRSGQSTQRHSHLLSSRVRDQT